VFGQKANRKKHLVVIEPDHDTRVILRTYLEEAGYEVTSFANGGNALDGLDELPETQLVFISSSLVFLSAEHIITVFKRHHRFVSVPFVQLQNAEEQQLSEVDRTVVRPIKKWELLVTVEKCLATQTRSEKVVTPP
jgi:DNA-binding NtrC family response regulator